MHSSALFMSTHQIKIIVLRPEIKKSGAIHSTVELANVKINARQLSKIMFFYVKKHKSLLLLFTILIF